MEELINNIRSLILTNKKPSYQTTNKREVRIRCPYCGDSKKDKSSAHLYIAMKPPFKFHCFKCETSGRLTASVLRDFEIYNNDLNLAIIEANKSLKLGFDEGYVRNFKSLQINKSFSNISEISKNYFNRRFNCNLESEYIQDKFRVILDPLKFCKDNSIYNPVDCYDISNAIGFLSSDSSHIVFRDTSGIQKTRYFNYNLYQDDDGSKIYNISNQINIMENEITLVLTEGIFDIIGVYLHFYKDTPYEKNTIFAAACGKGFNSVIAKYIRMGFLNLKVIIYSDGDVNESFYKNLKSSSLYLKNIPLTVYYNSLYDPKTGFGKDYGTSKEQIKLRKVVIY